MFQHLRLHERGCCSKAILGVLRVSLFPIIPIQYHCLVLHLSKGGKISVNIFQAPLGLSSAAILWNISPSVTPLSWRLHAFLDINIFSALNSPTKLPSRMPIPTSISVSLSYADVRPCLGNKRKISIHIAMPLNNLHLHSPSLYASAPLLDSTLHVFGEIYGPARLGAVRACSSCCTTSFLALSSAKDPFLLSVSGRCVPTGLGTGCDCPDWPAATKKVRASSPHGPSPPLW